MERGQYPRRGNTLLLPFGEETNFGKEEAANCGGLIDVWSGIRNYEPRTHIAKTVTINSAANVTRAIFRKS